MRETAPGATAIVTVSYNSSSQLEQFLRSIRETTAPDVTVIVADNGSADIAAARAVCSQYDAVVLELGNNLGYGGAINRAIASLPASVDNVLVSNPDVILHQGALDALLAAIRESPEAGAIGPRVLNADGSIYPSARELPSLRTGIGHALLGRIWRTNPWTAKYLSDVSTSSASHPTGWLSGSCMLVRRSAFDSIHGFDDAFFMYFEDVDLGYRLGKAGWASVYEPAAVVTHTGAQSTTAESGRMIKAHHRSAFQYLSRKYSAWYLAPLRWALGVGLAARAAWLTRK